MNQLARDHFNGGGHINAAGGAYGTKVEEAIEKFKSILPDYQSLLPIIIKTINMKIIVLALAFLFAACQQDNTFITESGLQYKINEKGNGEQPQVWRQSNSTLYRFFNR